MKLDDILYKKYKIVFNSCLFDEEWYVKEYFKNSNNEIDSIFHYLIEGSDNGYNPNAFFDTKYYLNTHSDVKKVGMNPLIHYIRHGKKEKRAFSPSFKLNNHSLEEHIFLSKNPNLTSAMNKIKKFELFDSKFYLKNNAYIKLSNVDPLIHYLSIGYKEHKNPSNIFDNDFYIATHPNIKNMNPLIHYVLYGMSENTSCIPKNESNKIPLSEKIDNLNKKINNLENEFRKELDNQNKILNSYYELLNLIYLTNNVKAKGVLRLVQLHSVELLKFVINICKKYNLTYWLDYGTLIGAIRHDGFVPWDDEIDISMPREDYEKIIKIIPKELKRFGIPKRVYLKVGHAGFTGVTTHGNPPSPISQFIDEIPLAHVDIHTLDYYEMTPNNTRLFLGEGDIFYKASSGLRNKLKTCKYETFEEGHSIEGGKIGITNDKTNFLGSPLDGLFRTPVNLGDIFPLIKKSFEGHEFFIPKNSVKYLQSSYYSGDMMKIPKIIRTHGGDTTVKKQLKNENYEEKYKEILKYWKNINNKFNE